MALYAIADLHLSFFQPKPMDIFSPNWHRHEEKIKANWCQVVQPFDTVMILGDISWAMTLEEARPDLNWINGLPGTKVLIKGNHDYWWTGINRLNQLYDGLHFIQNNFYAYGETALCGTRGWLCPNRTSFTQQDRKIYDREAARLENSLKMAEKAGYEEKIVMLHYPPMNDQWEPSLFSELCRAYQVKQVFYGHLHGTEAYGAGPKGELDGIEYGLVSCDYLDFSLLKVRD